MWRSINYRIFRKTCAYVMGHKFNGDFSIDCLHRDTGSDVVRIRNNFGGAGMNIYFGDKLHIGMFLCGPDGCKRWEHYHKAQDVTDPYPENQELYIDVVSAYLRELIRHSRMFDAYYWHYGGMRGKIPDFPDCPEYAIDFISRWHGILFIPVKFSDLDGVSKIISWMSSRRFRRARGDHK